jgi:hypothetical protein
LIVNFPQRIEGFFAAISAAALETAGRGYGGCGSRRNSDD